HGLLALQIAVGGDLVGQRVLLHLGAVALGALGAGGVVADVLFQVVGHRLLIKIACGPAPPGTGRSWACAPYASARGATGHAPPNRACAPRPAPATPLGSRRLEVKAGNA